MASIYTFDNSGKVVRKDTGLPPSAEDGEICDKAHEELMEADGAYQTALVKRYGHRAGDMRYQPDKQTPEIRALGDAFVKATNNWRATFDTDFGAK